MNTKKLEKIQIQQISNPFLKKLFNKEDRRTFKFDKSISNLLTKKTENSDTIQLIKSQFKRLTVPYDYSEISHLSKLIKLFYYKIAYMIIYETSEYEELVVRKGSFDSIEDLKKLYNSIYYCLKATNNNMYKISKKKIGRTKNYFVYKFLKAGKPLYILVNLQNYMIFDLTKAAFKINLIYNPDETNDDYIKEFIREYTEKRESQSKSSTLNLKRSSFSP